MISFERQVLLAQKTTYRIGGNAHWYIAPKSVSHLIEALQKAIAELIPLFLLGRGSNVLVSDSGWPGLVIDTTEINSINWDGHVAECESGALLHEFVQQSVSKGYKGIECLAGIPGTIGGGIVMNAGAFGEELAETFLYAEGVNLKTGQKFHIEKDEAEFGYRTSVFKKMPCCIVRAVFALEQGKQEELQFVFDDILKCRRDKQPLDLPNCGSVFKRPNGGFAGTLIEQCGLKGTTIGGAQISEKHANFIVNVNSATAEDVRMLIAFVQKNVYQKTGIFLEPEVIFAGSFSTPLFQVSQKD
jgi:UDP-N-acetylmuramate dehydrogenase